jgi:hypothetical protein
MISYKEFLNEALKLKHLTHIEDTIITLGVKGAKEALDMMEKTVIQLSGKSSDDTFTQIKADGAPAIIAGIDPGNKRFFVATKSLFNKTPKINYSNEDIDKNHPGKGLNKKLKEALLYLPKAYPKKGIFQCDFLFSKSDITKETIDDKKYITFTPNTITYAIPEKTPLANKILKKQIGVALHTEYKGDSILEMSAEALPSIKDFKETPDVFLMGTTIEERHVLFTEEESKELIKNIDELRQEIKKFKASDVEKLTEFSIEISAFLNSLVKDGKQVSNNSIAEFMTYLSNKERYTSSKYKTQKSITKNKEKFEKLKKEIRKMGGTLYYILLWNKNVSYIKDKMIKKVDELSSMNTFVRKNNTFIPTAPEGLVIVDRLKGNMVKLVDRMEFSRNNFLISNF